jgi:phage major head subunit gpT-like protein
MMKSLKKLNSNYPMILAKGAAGAAAVIHCHGEATITAAGESTEGKRETKINLVAYNGGPLIVGGYDAPIYVDLDGLTGLNRPMPILREHDKSRIVASATPQRVGQTVQAEGRLVGASADRQQVEELAADGFAWQASVGVRPSLVERIKAGVKAVVNGVTVDGPAYIARKSRLIETSIVTIGADADTFVGIAATDPGDGDSDGDDPQPASSLLAIKAERARRDAIEATAVRMIKQGGDIEAIEAAMDEAIKAGTNTMQFELQLLRNQRPSRAIRSGGREDLSGQSLEQAVEASVVRGLGLLGGSIEAAYNEQVLYAMDRHEDLRHGFTIKDLLCFAAERNGQRVSRHNIDGMMRGAFADVRASGLSTISVSGILSNIANKQLKASFEAIESAWRQVTEIVPVRDFKTITSYSLTGDATFQRVAPGGELKHAMLGEASYTNKANTYGRMFALEREDIINDDLGALRSAPQRLGLGAARGLNDVFWTEFQENAGNFFHSNNKNLIASGSSSAWYLLVDPMELAMIQTVFLNGRQVPTIETADADFKQLGIQMRGYFDFGVKKQEPRAAVKSPAALTIDAVTAANQLLLDQKDRDNKPLALRPAIMLVSTSNAATAEEINKGTMLTGVSSSKNPNVNIWAGRFRVVTSAYLTNT